jgi:predicted DNA-binding transcriptional regulator AlpA
MIRKRPEPAARPLNAREVGDLLGASRDTVKQIPPQELPYFKLGGLRSHRRYLRSDVEAYIARRRVG